MTETALLSWTHYVDSLPWERGALDQSTWWAALRGATLGVAPSVVLETAAARIKAAGDSPKAAKLNQQIRRAYAYAGAEQQNGAWQRPPEARPAFEPDHAAAFAKRVPQSVDVAWVRAHSPVKVPWLLTPAEFLFRVYELGDQVLVFSDYHSQGQTLWQKYSWHLDPDELNSFVYGHLFGVWFLCNPVDGHSHFNERQARMSRRSEESIRSFRYAVLESDCQPLDQWLRILVQLPLPIVSITHSGGKSLHALVMVDANSKVSWDETIRAIKPKLIYLGADVNALTAVRLTRLPNCYRGDRLQELLYLNRNPSEEPIWKRQ